MERSPKDKDACFSMLSFFWACYAGSAHEWKLDIFSESLCFDVVLVIKNLLLIKGTMISSETLEGAASASNISPSEISFVCFYMVNDALVQRSLLYQMCWTFLSKSSFCLEWISEYAIGESSYAQRLRMTWINTCVPRICSMMSLAICSSQVPFLF